MVTYWAAVICLASWCRCGTSNEIVNSPIERFSVFVVFIWLLGLLWESTLHIYISVEIFVEVPMLEIPVPVLWSRLIDGVTVTVESEAPPLLLSRPAHLLSKIIFTEVGLLSGLWTVYYLQRCCLKWLNSSCVKWNEPADLSLGGGGPRVRVRLCYTVSPRPAWTTVDNRVESTGETWPCRYPFISDWTFAHCPLNWREANVVAHSEASHQLRGNCQTRETVSKTKAHGLHVPSLNPLES